MTKFIFDKNFMNKNTNNYAFIDTQNLHMAILKLNWKIDYKKFRIYLQEHYNIKKAYMFMGYKSGEYRLYHFLRKVGYIIVFKPLLEIGARIKGNCDAEFVLQAVIECENYNKALLITGDGDFHCLIKYLEKKGKLLTVLAPSAKNCSILIRRTIKENLRLVSDLKDKIEYK